MTPSAGPLQRLGAMPVRSFVARYWQKQAVCLRQAIDGFASPVTAAQLFALARDPDVESRLVSAFAGRWQVRHGPFAASALPARSRPRWTLLVQGVDQHDAAVSALAARFRFLPAARFDDVMISYATDRGGVGPHVDQYDVFLLQAQGRRRWRVARNFDARLRAGLPLRVLAHFRHEEEWVLEPGDLLYLPPGVAHEGVAMGECVTISIGFRLPPLQEVAEAWSERQARVLPLSGRLADGSRWPTRSPARLPTSMVDAALRQLRRGLPSRVEMRRTLLENLSEPKPTVFFTAPRPALGLARFRQAARLRGLRLDLRSRLLYEAGDFAINGELQVTPPAGRRWLRHLANQNRLSARMLAAIKPDQADEFFSIVHNWYRYGWLHLAPK
jgi:50S ribosomal protein L16 3-hydroxylase